MIRVHLNQFSLIINLVVAMRLCLDEPCGLVLKILESSEAIPELSLGDCSFEELHFVLQKLYLHLR